MEPKRLNKFISDSGFCSRREADNLIEQGRVTVNGKMPDAGTKVTPKDKVRIDGEILSVKEEKPVYLVFNKPANMSATSDQSVRDNVVRAINFPATLEPTGLLEREAEGIIFLSNDGDFVRNMKRSDNRYEKEYLVTVDKPITADFLQKISGGSAPEFGEERKNNAVSKESTTRFRITLKPGTDHYLKRMCESLGYRAVHLQRLRFDTFTLAKLPTGHWRVLTPAEVDSLRSLMGGPKAPKASDSYERGSRSQYAGTRGGAGKTGADGSKNTRGAKPGAAASRRNSDAKGAPKSTAGARGGASKSRPGSTDSRTSSPKTGGRNTSAPKGGGRRNSSSRGSSRSSR